jgi:hypothetical protein
LVRNLGGYSENIKYNNFVILIIMDEILPQPPKNEVRLNKYLIFLLPVVAIFLVVSSFHMGRYSNKSVKPNDNNIIEKTERTSTPTAINPNPQITNPPIPKTSIPDEKIISAHLDENCKITVTSSEKDYEVPTGLADGINFKCKPSTIGKVSPLGKFLAYEDISGGIDSVMALFTVDYGRSVILGVWGTSTILDYTFLPDDKLIAINGYPDIFNEQWLTLFDLPKIFSDFSNNFNDEYLYLMPSNPTYKSTIQLPNVGETHRKISFSDNMVQSKSNNKRLLVQYSLDELLINNGNFTITPKVALTLVYYEDKQNVDPVNSPITKQILNSENSTNDYWAVDVINTKTATVLRSYLVDQKTGDVISSN